MNIDYFIDLFEDEIIEQYETSLVEIPLSAEDLLEIAHIDSIAEDMARNAP